MSDRYARRWGILPVVVAAIGCGEDARPRVHAATPELAVAALDAGVPSAVAPGRVTLRGVRSTRSRTSPDLATTTASTLLAASREK